MIESFFYYLMELPKIFLGAFTSDFLGLLFAAAVWLLIGTACISIVAILGNKW